MPIKKKYCDNLNWLPERMRYLIEDTDDRETSGNGDNAKGSVALETNFGMSLPQSLREDRK